MGRAIDVVIALLAVADLIVLIIAYPLLPPRAIGTLAVYLFDAFVVAMMALGFGIRIRNVKHEKEKFILEHWYEIIAMIPIVVFAITRAYTNSDTIVLGIMLRAMGLLYIIRLSKSVESILRFFGGNRTLQTFLIFFVALAILAFLLYTEEYSAQNSKIKNMGDALWVTVQTMSTASFGPEPVGSAGRIISSITMIVGVAVTGVFISVIASGLTRQGLTQKPNNSLAYNTKQTIKGKIDELERLSEEDFQVLLSILKSLRDSLQGSKSNL